ncbi:13565_t:CDS:2 [Funneliformis geosporum]|uniref:13565_t:CDS:1 n=1 Tax=Funneliformis geosporum TaxID=1117311 RepID=A0A9W4SDR7_9GLOM|nr:13565_t:CDS:2 [Funneliformis geosporum]
MTYKLFNFILILSYLFLRVYSFIPEGRSAHSTVLIDNKLYFFGGFVENAKSCTNQVFYLDLSQSFDLIAPPWVSLTQNAGILFKSCRGTALLNEKEQTIYLFGGLMRNNLNKDEFVSNVHSLNLKSLSWNVPNIEGTPPERRRSMKGVIDNTGKIYIFGGFTGPTLGSETIIRYNDMVILDTAELSWLIIPASKPYAANSYTATLLSNGVIVYIGGTETREATATSIDIKIINLFDTKTLTWSVKIATASNIISNRFSHTAVLASATKYDSSTPQSSPANVVTNNSNSTIKIISASIGGTVGAVIIIACGFLIYRWNKNRIELDPGEHKLPGSITQIHHSSYMI